MKPYINRLLDFIKFTENVRKVRRAIILDTERYGNDAEHCFQAAITALFIIETKRGVDSLGSDVQSPSGGECGSIRDGQAEDEEQNDCHEVLHVRFLSVCGYFCRVNGYVQ